MGTSDRVTKVPERVNPLDCRGDALRCLECEEELEELPSGFYCQSLLGMTAWDWVKVVFAAVLAGLLFWVMALGWPLLAAIGGAR